VATSIKTACKCISQKEGAQKRKQQSEVVLGLGGLFRERSVINTNRSGTRARRQQGAATSSLGRPLPGGS
jgi:hypothetical protein